MKKYVWIILSSLFLSPLCRAQSFEAQQLLLDVEKLSQLRQILQDLKKGYEVVLTGYTKIKDISEGNFNLHEIFLDGLLQVSPAVRNYGKVADIISLQLRIVSEYKSALKQCEESGQFTPNEIDYITKVYSHLFEESIKNLESLTLVLTSGELRMSDGERLTQIDVLYQDMQDKLFFLRHFNRQASVLALQRQKADNDLSASAKIYGLTH